MRFFFFHSYTEGVSEREKKKKWERRNVSRTGFKRAELSSTLFWLKRTKERQENLIPFSRKQNLPHGVIHQQKERENDQLKEREREREREKWEREEREREKREKEKGNWPLVICPVNSALDPGITDWTYTPENDFDPRTTDLPLCQQIVQLWRERERMKIGLMIWKEITQKNWTGKQSEREREREFWGRSTLTLAFPFAIKIQFLSHSRSLLFCEFLTPRYLFIVTNNCLFAWTLLPVFHFCLLINCGW